MLQWISANLRTGRVGGDLPGLEVQWPIRHTLSTYDTATATLNLDGAPPDWHDLVKAGATLLACYDDEDDGQSILWAGYVVTIEPDGATDTVSLSLSTVEGYLARRYVPDVTYPVGTLRDAIVADMVAKWIVAGVGPIPGVPIVVQRVGAGGPALTAAKVYQNTDNATVGSRIESLYAEMGGEYTITWAWSVDELSLIPTMFVGDHIGQQSATGIPAVTFEQPGPVVSVSQPTDYSDGAGANVITAYSSGQGSVTPYAPAVTVPADDRPAFEYRYQPVASEDDLAVLGRHAQQAAGILGPGARPLSLVLAVAELGTGRRYGVDWRVGDDLGYHVEPSLAFADGLDGVARAIAVEIGGDEQTGATTITPIFAQPEVYTEADA